MEKLEIANKKVQTMESEESNDPTSQQQHSRQYSLGMRTESSPLTSPALHSIANGSSSSADGTHPLALPRPDVQAWIMRARESIEQISGMYNGATYPVGVDEEEDGDEYEDGLEEVEEEGLVVVSEGSEEGYAVVGYEEGEGSESGVTIEAPLSDDGFVGERDEVLSNAEHYPPASDDDENVSVAERSGGGSSTRHASPATTVRSVSTRSGSAAPQRKGTSSSAVSAGTSAAARTVSKGPGAADPLKLISSLHTGIARMRSKSPTLMSTGMSTSRAGSVEQDVLVVSEGSSIDAGHGHGDENVNGVGGGAASGVGVDGTTKALVEGEDAYGAAGKEFFHARRGSAQDPLSLAPSRNPIPHILIQGIVTPAEAEKLFEM